MNQNEIEAAIKKLKAEAAKSEKPCPNCGYCPACGRSQDLSPVHWYPSPWYPAYPYGPIWTSPRWTITGTTATETIGIGAASATAIC